MCDTSNKVVWGTIAENPKRHIRHSSTGWRLHAIPGDENQSYRELGRVQALCGLEPRHGWGLDLFIDMPCLRCVEKALELGIAVPREIMNEYQTHSKHPK